MCKSLWQTGRFGARWQYLYPVSGICPARWRCRSIDRVDVDEALLCSRGERIHGEALGVPHVKQRRLRVERAFDDFESTVKAVPEPLNMLARRPYNAVADFVDINVARGLDTKIAFVEPARSLTYAELQAEICRVARGLGALGLRQESRIILLLLDTVEFPIAFLGAIRAGIVPIPLNSVLTTEQYAYIFEDSRAEALVISIAPENGRNGHRSGALPEERRGLAAKADAAHPYAPLSLAPT